MEQSYINDVLDVINTRFIYSYGKGNLTNLIKKGDDVRVNLKLTNKEYEYMLWDLE